MGRKLSLSLTDWEIIMANCCGYDLKLEGVTGCDKGSYGSSL